jgi:hypothetical protein
MSRTATPPSPGVDPALRRFYAEDPRRAHSTEVDVGLRWLSVDGSSYRAAWIADTGELYSVRHGHPAEGDRHRVLARLSADALERELYGWLELCDSDELGSYEALRVRAAAVAAAERRSLTWGPIS